MKTVTKKWLDSKEACQSSLNYVVENGYIGLSPVDFIRKLMTADRFSDANWLIVRCMNRKQRLAYAIFAAEQVISIYEKKYPNNDKPRKAIEAAKKVLRYDSKKNRSAAESAAWSATESAAESARSAAWSAWSAAESATESAWSAIQKRIIENGIKILGGK